MSRLRKLALLSMPAIVLAVAILEIGGLALIVPVDDVPIEWWDPVEQLIKYRPHQRGVTFPDGDRRHPVPYSINADGWNSAHPAYSAERTGAHRIALIGDSYVAAFQVHPEASTGGRLEDLLGGGAEVYAFGMNGAPLSQYLYVARHVVPRYRPDAIGIVLVHNDFDESYRHVDGRYTASFLRLRIGSDAIQEIPPEPYHASSVLDWIRVRSATFRFFFYRLRVGSQQVRDVYFRLLGRGSPRYEANVDVTALASEDDRLRRATRYLFEQLALLERTSGVPIVLLFDAPRYTLYEGRDPTGSEAYRLNRLAAGIAHETGITLIDLTTSFRRDWRQNGRRFEFPTDGHWNARAHDLAAHDLCRALAERDVVARDACGEGASR